jgi:hypothetical protein
MGSKRCGRPTGSKAKTCSVHQSTRWKSDFALEVFVLFNGLMRLSGLLRRVYQTVNCHILRLMCRLPCSIFNPSSAGLCLFHDYFMTGCRQAVFWGIKGRQTSFQLKRDHADPHSMQLRSSDASTDCRPQRAAPLNDHEQYSVRELHVRTVERKRCVPALTSMSFILILC